MATEEYVLSYTGEEVSQVMDAVLTDYPEHKDDPDAHHTRYTNSEAVDAINNDTDHGSTAQHNYFSGSYGDLTDVPTEFNPEAHGDAAHTETYAKSTDLHTVATTGNPSDLEQESATADDVLTWNGDTLTWEPQSPTPLYTDADAIDAINTDVDHGSTAQHNYFSGSYNDLTEVPSEFNPEAHGDAAHTETYAKSADLHSVATSGNPSALNQEGATDGEVLVWDDSTGEWVPQSASGGGDMLASTYDPQDISSDAFDRTKHTGTPDFPNMPHVGGQVLPFGIDGTLAPHKNLVIGNNSTNPDYQVDIDADDIILLDSNDNAVKVSNVDVTVDITSSGANGLDTGSEVSATWYHLWVIYNGTTVAGLLSTATTLSGLTLPSGYVYTGYVGAIYNNDSNNFRETRQRDKEVVALNTLDIDSGTATTTTAVSLSVPTTALHVYVNMRIDRSETGRCAVAVYPTSNSSLGSIAFRVVSTWVLTSPFVMTLIESQTLYYHIIWGDSINISPVGWRY